jgi:hypothetical protein
VQLLVSESDVENYKQIKADLDELRLLVEKSELWVYKSKSEGKKEKKKKDGDDGDKVDEEGGGGGGGGASGGGASGGGAEDVSCLQLLLAAWAYDVCGNSRLLLLLLIVEISDSNDVNLH